MTGAAPREGRTRAYRLSRMSDDWLSVAEAAKRLGVRPDTVYALAAKGELPATGWPVRVHRSELRAFIERSRVKPGDLRGYDHDAARPPGGVAQRSRARGRGVQGSDQEREGATDLPR